MKRWIREKQTLWLICPVALALLSALARLWQVNSAFEGDLGLAKPWAPATVVLTCLLVISAVLLALLAARQNEAEFPRGDVRRQWRKRALEGEGDNVSMTLTVLAAFMTLAAAPILFAKGMTLRREYLYKMTMGLEYGGNNGILMLATAITSLLAFGGLLMAARCRFRAVRTGKGESAVMLASVNGCLWLMECYRDWAADPVLWDYVPMLLATICGMVLYMDCAGLASGAYHPRRTLWAAGMTVVLSLVAMAGNCSPGGMALMAAQALAALAVLWRLPMNMEHPPAVELPRDLEEEIQEEDYHV